MVLIKRTDKNIHVVRLSMKVLIKNTRSVEYLEVTFMLRNNWSENMKCWLQTECFTFLLIYMFFIMFCSRHFKDGNIYKKKHKKKTEKYPRYFAEENRETPHPPRHKVEGPEWQNRDGWLQPARLFQREFLLFSISGCCFLLASRYKFCLVFTLPRPGGGGGAGRFIFSDKWCCPVGGCGSALHDTPPT